MKKLATVLMTAFLLSACAGTGSSTASETSSTIGSAIGSILGGGSSTTGTTTTGQTGITASLIKMYVNNQCATELNKRNEWRLVALALTAEKQAELEGKICGCVSEEAPNQVTAADMSKVLTESGRTELMATITAKTVTACYKRLVTGS